MHSESTVLNRCPRPAMLGRLLAVALVAALGAQRTAVADELPVRNLVYVESNDPGGNAIFGFTRDANGALAPLPGSPFAAGGNGTAPTFALGPFDSDQELIANDDGTLLFAVNGGSDSIAVFRIADDGTLAPVAGSPFPSGGSNPASLGLAGDGLLCVVNKDEDPGHPGQGLPNYTTMRVSSQGQLTPVPRSTVSVEAGGSPSQALVAPDGKLLLSTDFLGGLLRSFRIAGDGRLFVSAAQQPPAAEFADTGAPALPLGLAVHPTQRILYVGFVTISRLAVYDYGRAGSLNFVRTVPSSGKGMCWIRVNADGTRVYTSNTGDKSISVYDISDDPREPVEIQKVTLKGTGNGFQIELARNGKFLHAVTQEASPGQDASANALHTLKVNDDGTLTEVPTSPTVLPVTGATRVQGIGAL